MTRLAIEHPSLDLTKVALTVDSPLMPTVKTLYFSSFPANECIPYKRFVQGLVEEKAQGYAYQVGEEVVAFSYLLASDDMRYLFFLAVAPDWQSQGIGTAIVKDLKGASSLPLLVTIEPVLHEASHRQERLRRLQFYERQGFYQTDWQYQEGSEVYDVLTTEPLATYDPLPHLVDNILQGDLVVSVKRKISVERNLIKNQDF